MKILTLINWILLSGWGVFVIYAVLLPKGQSDAAGRGLEFSIIGLCFGVLIFCIVLNLLPYSWTKILALAIGLLLLLLAIYIKTN
jgi:hypothetical protein